MQKLKLSGTRILKNAFVRILIPPIAGFLFYGSWAFWANFDFGEGVALKAAATQGGYSFAITLILALIIEWLYQRLKSLPFHYWWVGFCACSLLYTTSWTVNFLAGTPNILLTILPGAIISTIYTAFYILALTKIN